MSEITNHQLKVPTQTIFSTTVNFINNLAIESKQSNFMELPHSYKHLESIFKPPNTLSKSITIELLHHIRNKFRKFLQQ